MWYGEVCRQAYLEREQGRQHLERIFILMILLLKRSGDGEHVREVQDLPQLRGATLQSPYGYNTTA